MLVWDWDLGWNMSEVITHIGKPTGLCLAPNSGHTASTTTANLKTPSLLRDIRHILCMSLWLIIVVFISLPSQDDPLLHLHVRLPSLRLGPNTLQAQIYNLGHHGTLQAAHLQGASLGERHHLLVPYGRSSCTCNCAYCPLQSHAATQCPH
ncbi:hypothetical protein Taro_013582 [Colocasia esculenta]|uniref:Uncharacterized protein n=1 Tax=Colocasia esculenta TaxID=4460 RepID=A0A843U6X2_COLES|nr:hypothetical protein [Colocasia esculenta]